MKKAAALFFAVFSFAFFAALPALAQEEKAVQKKLGDWTISLDCGFGARIGVYDEIVWAKRKYDGERYKQSELNYIMLPAFYTSLNLSANYKRLGLSLSNKFFLAAKTGTLTDSDWRNDDYCKNGDTSTKTDWSEHTLYLNDKYGGVSGFDLELKGDFKFYPTSFLTLAPVLSFNAQYMYFNAKNGYGYYGVYDYSSNRILSCYDPTTRLTYSFEGREVLKYEVYNLYLWTGIKAIFTPKSWLRFELTSEVSALSLLFDYDQHLTNSKDFKEIAFSAFFAFRQSVKTEFVIKKNFSICQTCVFVISGESEGSMYFKKKEEPSYSLLSNNTAGGQVTYLDLELSAKFSW